MKFLIASDIHGSAKYLKMLLKAFETEKADKMLLLGDILYHGPRNDLPQEYAPKEIIALLNPLKDKILCVRGNCDTEVDQMVLDFPILADYAVIPVGNRILYATHGHKYNPQTPPPLSKGDILINGHTHIPKCEDMGDFTYLNCGSVSIPKENSAHSYMTLENGKFLWKDLQTGKIYNEYEA
ncbi:MAG: phosphodiesterase [Clostridia bacterium]|nr:phosphodiesterase [Clostridia bacterium]